MLWTSAPISPAPIQPKRPFLSEKIRIMTTVEASPPETERTKAVKPLVKSTNTLLIMLIETADTKETFFAAAITATLEKPILIPGGSRGERGNNVSRKDAAMAKAESRPLKAILKEGLFVILSAGNSVKGYFSLAGYAYRNPCGYAGGHFPPFRKYAEFYAQLVRTA